MKIIENENDKVFMLQLYDYYKNNKCDINIKLNKEEINDYFDWILPK